MPAKQSNNHMLLLLIVPMLFILISINMRMLQGAYYQAYFLDPSYAYLLNSLNIAHGEPPAHVDHPGTTVQLLGGMILKINSLFGRLHGESEDITMKVLLNPEDFISIISNAIICIIAISVFIFGIQLYKNTSNILLSITSQIFPLSFPVLLEHLPRLEPEPLLVASAYLLAAALVPFATGAADEQRVTLRAIIVGIILGVGVTTKVTFAPLLLSVFILPKNTTRGIALVSCMATAYLLTIPIHDNMRQVASWLFGIMTHTGHYATGPTGLPSASTLLASGIRLFKENPVLCFPMAMLLTALFFAEKKRVLLVMLSASICCIIIVMKHYSQHYLMQLMGFSCLLIAVASVLLCKNKYTLYAIAAISCILTCNSFVEAKKVYIKYINIHDNYVYLHEIAEKKECIPLEYYRSSSRQYALFFGNGFAGSKYNKELAIIYPKYIFYSNFEKKFRSVDKILSIDDICLLSRKNKQICLLGTNNLLPDKQMLTNAIAKKGDITLYQVRFNDCFE